MSIKGSIKKRQELVACALGWFDHVSGLGIGFCTQALASVRALIWADSDLTKGACDLTQLLLWATRMSAWGIIKGHPFFVLIFFGGGVPLFGGLKGKPR